MNISPNDLVELGGLMGRLGRTMQRTALLDGNYMAGEAGEVALMRPHLPPGPATYVDVGAAEPESCSNTWPFYSEGWHGLLIEPLPTYWYRLLRLRPRDRLLPIAVSNEKGFAQLRACESCSSIRPDWNIREHAQLIVETDTLANILADYPEIRDQCQLCSIDVEGWERQVLQGIDWKTFRPAVFVIEYRQFHPAKLGADLSGDWELILDREGYRRVAETRLNYIYTNTESENTDGT